MLPLGNTENEIKTGPPDTSFPATLTTSIRDFSKKDIRKLQSHLRNATNSHQRNYLQTYDLWTNYLLSLFYTVISGCCCQLAFPQTLHPAVIASPPGIEAQAFLTIDVILLHENNLLHCLDRVTGWSEAGALHNRELSEQARIFRNIQTNNHFIPLFVLCDQEYNKGSLLQYCNEMMINLLPVVANAHESNGAMERANITLRSYFDCFRVCYHQSRAPDLVSDAAYGKISTAGRVWLLHSSCSTVDLHESGDSTVVDNNLSTIQKYAEHIARRRIDAMLQSNVREPQNIEEHCVSVLRNVHIETSIFNRVRLIDAGANPSDSIFGQQIDKSTKTVTSDYSNTDDDLDSARTTETPLNNPSLPNNSTVIPESSPSDHDDVLRPADNDDSISHPRNSTRNRVPDE